MEGKLLPVPGEGRDYFTIKEVAEVCNVTTNTVYRWIRNDSLYETYKNGIMVVMKEDLNDYSLRKIEEYEYQRKERAAHSYGQYIIRRRQRGR